MLADLRKLLDHTRYVAKPAADLGICSAQTDFRRGLENRKGATVSEVRCGAAAVGPVSYIAGLAPGAPVRHPGVVTRLPPRQLARIQ